MAEQQKCRKLAAVLVEHQEYFSVMTDEDCQWAIQNPKDAVALFANAVKNRSIPKLETDMPEIFRLTVDYGQSLEQMVAAGHYDLKNDDITAKRFTIKGEGIIQFEAHYFHFNRTISSDDAVKEIEKSDTANPWSAAKIEHVLSHGATFPEEQRKFPIIGLGSVAEVDGDRNVPCLDRDGSYRRLDLNWWSDDWDPNYRFLAVRKVSVS
ncbi:MAG: hypothetical protein NTY93_00210 [Candidatus Kaiserbacteria bacterium]|nr:hypothetical protein [Candidatus Kaiserbacteria bacterium]